MACIFISHSSQDNGVAAWLKDALALAGYPSTFLDFDDSSGIEPGAQWERSLYAELRRADVVVFLATHAAVDSKWCHAELALARALDRRVIPLLVEPGAHHPLLADTQELRVPPDGTLPDVLRDELRGLRLDVPEWDASLPPYPGMEPFDDRREAVFFGRDEDIDVVVDRLRALHADAADRLVLLTGPSGSGKSSLLRAGVLPRLGRLDGGWRVLSPFVPLDAPVDALARSLGTALGDPERCQERLRGGPDALVRLVSELSTTPGGRVVLGIDQAEQFVTYESREERIAFLDLLAGALARPGPLRVVMTLRSEYQADLLEGTRFEGRPIATVTVKRLADESIAEIITRPAQRAGIDFEDGLVDTIVADTRAGLASGGDPLPVLAFALRRLYDARHDEHEITRRDYAQIGGVVGALVSEADGAAQRFAERGMQALVIPTLLELVHVEEEREPVGRSVRDDHFDDAEREVVDAFVEARLLTRRDGTVSLAHETLVRAWPTLTKAIEASRDKLVARSRLERAAREWELAKRDPSYLIHGRRLDEARSSESDDPLVADLLTASRRAVRRQRRRLRGAQSVAVVLIGAAFTLAGLSVAEAFDERSARASARGPTGPRQIDLHEVTYRQYRLCVEERRCARPADDRINPTLEVAPPGDPVVLIDQPQAAAFCQWVGRSLPTLEELDRAASQLDHRLEGGIEWTSTVHDKANAVAGVDPESGQPLDYSDEDHNPSDRDPGLGFRCVAD